MGVLAERTLLRAERPRMLKPQWEGKGTQSWGAGLLESPCHQAGTWSTLLKVVRQST